MTTRGFARFLAFSLVLAFFLPGPALAADTKAHEQYLHAAKLYEQDRYEQD